MLVVGNKASYKVQVAVPVDKFLHWPLDPRVAIPLYSSLSSNSQRDRYEKSGIFSVNIDSLIGQEITLGGRGSWIIVKISLIYCFCNFAYTINVQYPHVILYLWAGNIWISGNEFNIWILLETNIRIAFWLLLILVDKWVYHVTLLQIAINFN